jgi:hypothetical protein
MAPVVAAALPTTPLTDQTALAFMLDNTQITTIAYALTLEAASCPVSAAEITALCGQIPQRGPTLGMQFAQCGHDAIVALWIRLIAENTDVAAFADAAWALYQSRMAQPTPSLASQAVSAAGAVCNEVAAIVKSEPPVPPEEAERRFAICQGCEGFLPDAGRCSRCGCVMRVKTTFRTASCPLGNW